MKRRGPSLVCSEGCEEYTGQPTIPNRREKPFFHHKCLKRMAGTTGLEPAASAVTGQRSNQLNYVPSLFSLPLLETRVFSGFPHVQSFRLHRPFQPRRTKFRG